MTGHINPVFMSVFGNCILPRLKNVACCGNATKPAESQNREIKRKRLKVIKFLLTPYK